LKGGEVFDKKKEKGGNTLELEEHMKKELTTGSYLVKRDALLEK